MDVPDWSDLLPQLPKLIDGCLHLWMRYRTPPHQQALQLLSQGVA